MTLDEQIADKVMDLVIDIQTHELSANAAVAKLLALIEEREREARILQTEDLIKNAMNNSTVMGFVSSAKSHLAHLKQELEKL